MSFVPQHFQGAALLDLVQVLAQAREDDIVAGLDRHALLPRGSWLGMGAPPADTPIEWRTTWLTTQDPADALLCPTHLKVEVADVEVGEYVGGGTQGAVYKGQVRVTGLIVAIKVIRDSHGSVEVQAIREARIGSKLLHQNIVRIFDARRAGAFWVVVMEFLQGKELSETDLQPARAMSVLSQLSSAVLTMARENIVHRDIKPQNVVVRQADSRPVLIDLGLAIDLRTILEPPSLAGTPFFMAPEAFSDQLPDSSWDAYSLGVTAITLMVADQIPRGSNFSELVQMKVRGEFDRRAIELLSEVPDGEVRRWCQALLRESLNRLKLLEQARDWTINDLSAEQSASADRPRD